MINYLNSLLNSSLAETLIWEYYAIHAECMYKIDTGSEHEVKINANRKVCELYDNTLSQLNAVQTNNNNKPILLTKSERRNKRYFLKFNSNQRMISDIDLNPTSSSSDVINVFISVPIKKF